MTDNHLSNSPEIWKAIPGFEGYYDVSDQGRVRSYWQRVGNKGRRGTKMVLGNTAQKIITLGRNPINGYLMARIYKPDKDSTITINRLVLLAFVGPCPPEMESCHNDGKKFNNFLINLRWDYRSNNVLDKINHDVVPHGEQCWNSKLTEEKVIKIRELSSEGYKGCDLAIMFSESRQNISRIILRRTWKHI